MKIFNIQQLFIGRRLRFISFSFIFVVFFFALPNVANADVSVSSSSNPTCHNGTNGSVTVKATSVGSGSYVYTINDGTTSTSSALTSDLSYTFSNLSASLLYTITLSDNGVDAGNCSITLTDPGELSIDVTPVKGWTCGATNCVGELTLNFSEGANRTITVTELSISSNTSPLSLSALCPGTYTFTLTDGNGCTPSSVGSSYTIEVDNAGPSCTNSPVAELVDAVTYLSSIPVIDTVSDISFVSTGGQRYIYPAYAVFNSSSRNNLEVQLLATPTGNTWGLNDSIKVEVSYDNGTTWGTPVIESANGGTPSNLWIPLNNNQQDIQIRVICVSSSLSDYYTVDHLYVRGTNPSKTIVTSGPSGCSDNFATTLTTTFSDGPVTWYCTTAGSPEFKFNRTWSVFDGCKYTDYNQLIAVGEYPTFTGPAQTYTYDFCHPNQTITCPTFTDGCDPAPIVSYVIIDDITTAQFNAGTGSPFTYSFPVPTQNDTVYTVRWTVTDQAGFSRSIDETVNILRPMHISLVPFSGDEDFCTGEEVQFTVSVVGGTGAYAEPTFTPASSVVWSSLNGNISGTYTTKGLLWDSGAGTNITVVYTDTDNGGVIGGCTTTTTFINGTDGFTVHPNITTNAITRMP